MDPAITFYQTLSGISFTLLGLWFATLQFAHGGWHSDPVRHRSTLHIALHFFLPGGMGLASLLTGSSADGLLWRAVFIVGGLVGVAESLAFFRAPGGPVAAPGRALRAVDPLLYALVVVGTVLPGPVLGLKPLQVEGLVTGSLFMVGLCYLWLAFSERDAETERAAVIEHDAATERRHESLAYAR